MSAVENYYRDLTTALGRSSPKLSEVKDSLHAIFSAARSSKNGPVPMQFYDRLFQLRGRVKAVSHPLATKLARNYTRRCLHDFPGHKQAKIAQEKAEQFILKYPEFNHVHALYNFLNHSNIEWRLKLCKQLLGDDSDASPQLVAKFFEAMEIHAFTCEKYMAFFDMHDVSLYIRSLPILTKMIHSGKEAWVERATEYVINLGDKDRIFFLEGLSHVMELPDVTPVLVLCRCFVEKYKHFLGAYGIGTGSFYKEILHFSRPKDVRDILLSLEKIMEQRPYSSIQALSNFLREYRKGIKKADAKGVCALLKLVNREPFLRKPLKQLNFLASSAALSSPQEMLVALEEVKGLDDEVDQEIVCTFLEIYCGQSDRVKLAMSACKDPLFAIACTDFSDFHSIEEQFVKGLEILNPELDALYIQVLNRYYNQFESDDDFASIAIVMQMLRAQEGLFEIERFSSWACEQIQAFLQHRLDLETSTNEGNDQVRKFASSVIESFYLFGLHDQHPALLALLPLTQEEVTVDGIPRSAIGVAKHARYLRGQLAAYPRDPINAFGQSVTLDLNAMREKVLSHVVKRSDIPKHLTVDLWNVNLEQFYSKIAPEDVLEIKEGCFESPFMQQIFLKSEELLTADEILFWSAFYFIQTLSSDTAEGEYFSPREEALLRLGHLVRDCDVGKSRKLEEFVNTYVSTKFMLKPTTREGAEGERPLIFLVSQCVRFFAARFAHDSALMHEAVGVRREEITQWPHQARYLNNVLGVEPFRFDTGGDTVDHRLMRKLTADLSALFVRHFTPNELIQYTMDAFNTLSGDERFILSQALYELEGFKEETLWTYGDGVRINEIGALKLLKHYEFIKEA
jgi:hypothetical protein